MFSDLAQEDIVRSPREPQAWLASMVVTDDHDVTVGIGADRDPDTEESPLVLHCGISAMVIAVVSWFWRQARGHTAAHACPNKYRLVSA